MKTFIHTFQVAIQVNIETEKDPAELENEIGNIIIETLENEYNASSLYVKINLLDSEELED